MDQTGQHALSRVAHDENSLETNQSGSDSDRTMLKMSLAIKPVELRRQLSQTIEMDILPRMVLARRASPLSADLRALSLLPSVCADVPAPPPLAKLIAPAQVDEFAQLLLGTHDDVAVSNYVGAIRGCGADLATIYLELLGPAARRLGELWEDDRCDFTEVTIGLGRLQHALRELSPEFHNEVESPERPRRVLLVPAHGDQHLFGLLIVAEFFRREGWGVWGGSPEPGFDPLNDTRDEWFDVVGMSLGSGARLDRLTEDIKTVRRISRNREIVVMVGGPIFATQPELVAAVGADGTAASGPEAVQLADRLLAVRGKPRSA